MPEQAPQEQDETRFPQLYETSDKVVNNVGSQSLPAKEVGRRRPCHVSAKFGVLTRIVIDRVLHDHALQLAEGDGQRLVLRPDGSVIVANNHDQAKRALRDRMFGAVEASDTATRLDNYIP